MGLLNFVCPKQNLVKDECQIKGCNYAGETAEAVTFVTEVTHTGVFEQWASRTEYTVSSFLSALEPLKYNAHFKIDAIMTTNIGFDELRVKYRNIRSTYYVKCAASGTGEYDIMLHDVPNGTPTFVKEEFGKMKVASSPSDAVMTSGYIYLMHERLYDGTPEVFPFTQFVGNTFCQNLIKALNKENKNGKSNES